MSMADSNIDNIGVLMPILFETFFFGAVMFLNPLGLGNGP